MSSSQRFDSKDPGESVPLTYDFTLGLATGETLTGTPTVSVRVVYANGTPDPNPQAIVGTPSFDNTNKLVFVPVSGGLDQTDYDIVVSVNTTNAQKKFVLGAILPVRLQ